MPEAVRSQLLLVPHLPLHPSYPPIHRLRYHLVACSIHDHQPL